MTLLRLQCSKGCNAKGNKKTIGHHARHWRASPTAPLRTGADRCKTGSGAGKRSGAESKRVCRRNNHKRTDDQAGRRRRASIDASGDWRMHTTDGTPSRNTAAKSKHCNFDFMCQGVTRPTTAAGLSRNGTIQAMAATPGTRWDVNAVRNTALKKFAWTDPEQNRKKSSRTSVIAT